MSQLGGGWLHGVPDQRGEMTGQQIMYIYPDLTTVLWGEFSRGLMVRAVHTRLADIDLRGLVPRAIVSQNDLGGPQFSLSPSTATTMEVSPLLQDPYETRWVTVRQSTVVGGGDGLFARREIPADTVISFYHGLVYRPGEGGQTEAPDYMIYLDWRNPHSCHSMDLPSQYWSRDNYRASLAHKVNHSFQPNAVFVRFQHPRFGLRCLAIRTFRTIPEGGEVFVHYRYDPDRAPLWYSTLLTT